MDVVPKGGGRRKRLFYALLMVSYCVLFSLYALSRMGRRRFLFLGTDSAYRQDVGIADRTQIDISTRQCCARQYWHGSVSLRSR